MTGFLKRPILYQQKQRANMKSIIMAGSILSATLLTGETSFGQKTKNHSTTHLNKEKMSAIQIAEKNKETIASLYNDILNKRKFELLNDIVSDDYTNPQGEKGASAFQKPLKSLIAALPDAQWKVIDLIAEGNKVIVIQQFTGTHTHQFESVPAPGPTIVNFQNIPVTGKSVTNNGIGIYEFSNGKIIASRVQTDRLAFLQDLGVLPTDLTSFTPSKTGEK
jgi:predicted ester cyclase